MSRRSTAFPTNHSAKNFAVQLVLRRAGFTSIRASTVLPRCSTKVGTRSRKSPLSFSSATNSTSRAVSNAALVSLRAPSAAAFAAALECLPASGFSRWDECASRAISFRCVIYSVALHHCRSLRVFASRMASIIESLVRVPIFHRTGIRIIRNGIRHFSHENLGRLSTAFPLPLGRLGTA